jgi:hypothetical protein
MTNVEKDQAKADRVRAILFIARSGVISGWNQQAVDSFLNCKDPERFVFVDMENFTIGEAKSMRESVNFRLGYAAALRQFKKAGLY